MLPSCGYFKNIVCPFFASGLCERPHCHFRHEKRNSDIPSRQSPQHVPSSMLSSALPNSTASDSNKLIQLYDEAIRKIQEEVASCETKSLLVKKTPAVNSHVRALPVPTYIPTPVNRAEVRPPRKASASQFPNYTPTPIAQLKRLRGSSLPAEDDKHYDPTEYAPIKKKKKVEEYDPTKVLPVASSGKSLDTVPVLGSVDDSAEKFSDDSDGEVGGAAFSDSDVECKDELENEKENEVVTEKENLKSGQGELVEKFDVVSQILQASKKSNEFIKNPVVDKESTVTNESVNKKDTKTKSKLSCNSAPAEQKESVKVKNGICSKSITKKDTKKLDSQLKNASKSLSVDKKVNKVEKLVADKTVGEKHLVGKEGDLLPENSKISQESLVSVGTEQKIEKKHVSKSDSPKKSSSAKHRKEQSSARKDHTKKNSADKKLDRKDSAGSFTDKKRSKREDKKSEKKDSAEKLERTTRDLNSKSIYKDSAQKKLSSKSRDHKSKNKNRDTESKSSKKKKGMEVTNASKKEDLSKNGHHSEKSSSRSKTEAREKSHNSSKSHKNDDSKKSVKKTDERNAGKKRHRNHTKSGGETSDSDNSSLKKLKKMKLSSQSSFAETLALYGDVDNFETNFHKNGIAPSPKEDDQSHFSEIDLSCISEDTDLDDHDTYEECWRIFNETPAVQVDDPNIRKMNKFENALNNSENSLVPSKKRVAHKPSLQKDAVQLPSHCRIAPSQAMYNRFLSLQKMYSEEQTKKPSFVTKHSHPVAKRIAHVPNASLINASRQKFLSLKENSQTLPDITVATTVMKGARRIAHIPAVIKGPRPTIPSEYGSKVPSVVRQRYLNLIIDECLKIHTNEKKAFERGLKEEKNSYERSTNKTVYLNVVINTLKRLRDEAEKGPIEEEEEEEVSVPLPLLVLPPEKPTLPKPVKPAPILQQKKTISHEMVLGGAKAARTSFSIEKKALKPHVDNEIRGEKLYLLLKPYILTEQQLEENGFPRINPDEPGKALFMKTESKKGTSNDPLQRICCRCQTSYRVDKKGIPLKIEDCTYHWGKLWNQRQGGRGSFVRKYNCCQGDADSDGCCVGKSHVHEEEYDKLKGFVKTLPKPSSMQDSACATYSLDCEMCYTTLGIELSRVTVIGDDLKPVYEALVKPDGPVIDYNTRFSGISEEDLEGVRTSIRDVQAVLLSMFNEKTILMGHSLESDFRALRLIHSTVVDTSLVFPHRLGPPYKRALRTLMAEYLNKIIQNSVEGHDSQEDALACMQLMLWKVKDDIKIGR